MSDLQHGADGYDEADGDGPIYEERRGLRPVTRMLVISAIAITVVAFAGLVWFAYNEGVRSGAEEAAPVLRADSEPVKRKPEDAGGMAIPHQDKLVYNRIAPGQAEAPVERLLPPPEAPVERPTQPADAPTPPPVDTTGSETSSAAAPEAMPVKPATTGNTVAEVVFEAGKEAETAMTEKAGEAAAAVPERPFVRITPDEASSPPPAPPAPPGAKPEPEPATQQAAVPRAPVVEPAPETAKPAAPAGPAWRIQLASLTSAVAARSEWTRLQKANADLLGALDLNVQKATLSKGTYYRIQAGPLADRAAAGTLCSALKSRKQDCLVVAP
ncbi:MAG: SPOR domain-containing protein [Alphaproteobacteria bacterium]|jgi:cell division septation protein DedD